MLVTVTVYFILVQRDTDRIFEDWIVYVAFLGNRMTSLLVSLAQKGMRSKLALSIILLPGANGSMDCVAAQFSCLAVFSTAQCNRIRFISSICICTDTLPARFIMMQSGVAQLAILEKSCR